MNYYDLLLSIIIYFLGWGFTWGVFENEKWDIEGCFFGAMFWPLVFPMWVMYMIGKCF